MTTSSHCYCHTQTPYDRCCLPFHDGISYPPTTLHLLKSRYAAFACRRPDYIQSTMVLPALAQFNRHDIEHSTTVWVDLKVIESEAGQLFDQTGTITFDAYFKEHPTAQVRAFRETSAFVRSEGRWMYAESLAHDMIDL